LADDVNVELLFDDRLVVAAGINNRFARRRKIDLAVVDEPWILAPPGTWHHARVQEAFQAQGLGMPKGSLNSLSMTPFEGSDDARRRASPRVLIARALAGTRRGSQLQLQ
jgi:DNA-binding transcriptional LysR family regulator